MDVLVADPVLLAGFGLFGLDRSRGVADVGLAGAELFEAAAGAGGADRDLDARVFGLELLGDRFGQRGDGARAVDADRAGQVAASTAGRFVVAATAGRDSDRQGGSGGDDR